MVVAGGGRRPGELFTGDRGSVWEDEEVLEMPVGTVVQQYLMPLSSTLENG